MNPCGALGAFAADVFYYSVEVFLAVIVNNFFAGLDGLAGVNPHAIFGDDRFRVGRARMVDVTRHVIAAAPVNRPFLSHPEEIFAVALVNNLVRHARPDVLDDLLAFGNTSGREQPQARA